MSDTQVALTPMSDHVDRFWRLLKTEHVRILVQMKRGTDGISYFDSSSFSDSVAKALVDDRDRILASIEPQAVAEPVGEVVNLTGSLNDMAVIQWVSGFQPIPGAKLYASPVTASDAPAIRIRSLKWHATIGQFPAMPVDLSTDDFDPKDVVFWTRNYSVSFDHFGASAQWEWTSGGKVMGRCDSLKEAQDTVQAHHDASLRADIEFVTASDNGLDETIEAAHETAATFERSALEAWRQFKNFHRLLCERFEYTHDEKYWHRDQVSLIEWIANRGVAGAASDERAAEAAARVITANEYGLTDGEPDHRRDDWVNENWPKRAEYAREILAAAGVTGHAVTAEMVNAAWNRGKDLRMTGLPSDFREVLQAALAAAPKAQPVQGWQTMDSAPKDGTRILTILHREACEDMDGIKRNAFSEVREIFYQPYTQFGMFLPWHAGDPFDSHEGLAPEHMGEAVPVAWMHRRALPAGPSSKETGK